MCVVSLYILMINGNKWRVFLFDGDAACCKTAQLVSCVNKECKKDNLKGLSAVMFNFQIKCLQKAIVQIFEETPPN